MRTLDATPICNRESPPHKRRSGKHRQRPFVIEGRYIVKRAIGFLEHFLGQWSVWHVVGSYETERGRDNALRAKKNGHWKDKFEYRLAMMEKK